LFGLSWLFVRNSLKPDLAMARQLIPGWGGSFADGLLRGYGTHEQEVARLEQRARRLAPLLVLLWSFLMSYVAYDYIMSLDQTWFSTLFGVYVIVGEIYTALTLLLVIIVFVSKLPGVSDYMTLNRFNDLAKLTFAFAMLYGYMVFSQYLVIWYSDLPDDSPFLIIRSIDPTPWRTMFWTLFVILFMLPFIGLPSKAMCRRPRYVATMAVILWVAQWFAHYLLVVPSVQYSFKEAYHFVFGAPEVLLTLGFAGAFFLCFFGFMSRVPLLPISDKHLCKTWHGH
ncbi:MAG TPA: molybdopterin oxidoreductase, partial [bacterium]|nr:molybdopterin oxidoreductase [bacterium]